MGIYNDVNSKCSAQRGFQVNHQVSFDYSKVSYYCIVQLKLRSVRSP